MQQVKIFTNLEDNTQDLENEINKWIAESGAKVLQITGNIAPQSVIPTEESRKLTSAGSRRFAPSDVVVIVLYEK